MKSNLHKKTLIAILREHVNAWRKAESWSREMVTQVIVEAHESIGTNTGIVFEKNEKDAYTGLLTNAQRMFRWLDDETKDKNLLPVNLIPSILAAMPIERRLMCASEIMVSIGLGACMPSDGEEGDLTINDVFEAQRDDLDATQALADAIQHPTAENLERAERKLNRAQKRKERLQKMLVGARKAMTATKAVFSRVIHPKREAA